jgi:uncharacterized protein (TIGR03083 family)
MRRDEVLHALERDRAQLQAALEGLDNQVMTTVPVVGEWTIKDVLGHMAMWHQVGLQFIADYKQTGLPKSLGFDDDAAVDAHNRREAERRRAWSVAQVGAELDTSYRDLAAAVASLTDEQLNAPLPAPWHSATTLERLIAINSYEHDPEHIGQMIKWREESQA